MIPTAESIGQAGFIKILQGDNGVPVLFCELDLSERLDWVKGNRHGKIGSLRAGKAG